MNVIITNKYKEMLMSLDIEVIKSLEGQFAVEEIISNFSNFYFDRMILDITALKDYNNLDTLQKLSINLDMNKIILLLDDSEESNSKQYLSKLISIGIYNFTRNLDGIKYLINNPNSYRDVAHIHVVNDYVTTNTVSESESVVNKIIGVKSLTEGAGSTTLVYMLKKHLESNYSVCALEVGKRDFTFFDSKDMISIGGQDLAKELMKRRDFNVILVDLNDYVDTGICNEVIYLVEPSTIKLNKLLLRDKRVFEKYNKDKIVLNKSNIKNNEINEFEYETKCKVFYNMPHLNERKDVNKEINELLSKLGFAKQSIGEEGTGSGKLLGMFKF